VLTAKTESQICPNKKYRIFGQTSCIMKTIELKDILIHKISAINDKSFLAAMNTIVDTKSEKLIYKTTPEQKQRIKEAQKQFAGGESISNDQVEARIDKWLSEK
jgi:hypothetical protein